MPISDHLRLEATIHRAFGDVMFCKHLAEICDYQGISDDLAQIATELAALGEALISAKQTALRRPRARDPQMTLEDFPGVWKADRRI